MIVMFFTFNTMLTCYNVKIIALTRLRNKRQIKNKSQQESKEQIN